MAGAVWRGSLDDDSHEDVITPDGTIMDVAKFAREQLGLERGDHDLFSADNDLATLKRLIEEHAKDNDV